MEDRAIAIINEHAQAGSRLREEFFAAQGPFLKQAALETCKRLIKGKKILFCGNGGSAADCQHLAAEFVNRFLINRPALPAIALTTDTSILTSVGNDFDFAEIFARQVDALGQKGDVLWAISTSGNSANILKAISHARTKELWIIGLTGNGGGAMRDQCDLLLEVPSTQTPLIQEIHLACEHLYCQLVDYYLFENVLAVTA